MPPVLRRPRLSDAPALFELVAECDTAALGFVDYEPADAVDELSTLEDRERDAWVAHDDDRLVGYAALHRPAAGADVLAELYVLPGGDDELERDLRQRLEGRAIESGATSISVWSVAGSPLPDARRLAAGGYAVVRNFSRMVVDVSRSRLPDPPAGVAVRVPSPADFPAVHAVVEEAFAHHFDHRPRPFEDWLVGQLEGSNADPALWLLAEAGGEPVGTLIGRRMEGQGWVRYLGTVPAHRGLGIARTLLLTAFATFAEQGFPEVALGVDSSNDTGALRLYESVGMRVAFSTDMWRRPLTP